MEISILLANKILSMLLACLIGFITIRAGLLKVEDSKILSKILAFVCSPFAIVSAYQIEFTKEKAYGLLIALGLAIVLHIIYIVVIKLIGNVLKLEGIERAAIIYSNAGYLTIPVVYTVLGPEWVFYTCAYSAVQTILIWTHCKSLISGKRVLEFRKALVNPNFIAIYIGVFMFLTGIRFPAVVQTTMSDFSALLGPLSMTIVGMLMGKESIKDMVSNKRIYLICVLRLVLMPLITTLVFLVMRAFISHSELSYIMLIVLWAASGPVASIVSQLAQIYDGDSQYAGRLNLVSVVLCLITMPLITYLFTWI